MAKKYIPSYRKHMQLSADDIRRAVELREKHGLTYGAIAKRFEVSSEHIAQLIRKHQIESEKVRILDRQMVPQMCTRPQPHDGPCNGFPRAGCPTL